MHAFVLLCINQHKKSKFPTFNDSKDKPRGPKFKKMGQVTGYVY